MDEDKVELLVEQWSLEEVFELLEITPQQVILILLEGGHVTLPPFLEDAADVETDNG